MIYLHRPVGKRLKSGGQTWGGGGGEPMGIYSKKYMFFLNALYILNGMAKTLGRGKGSVPQPLNKKSPSAALETL